MATKFLLMTVKNLSDLAVIDDLSGKRKRIDAFRIIKDFLIQ